MNDQDCGDRVAGDGTGTTDRELLGGTRVWLMAPGRCRWGFASSNRQDSRHTDPRLPPCLLCLDKPTRVMLCIRVRLA